jgi:hypothetical protein
MTPSSLGVPVLRGVAAYPPGKSQGTPTARTRLAVRPTRETTSRAACPPSPRWSAFEANLGISRSAKSDGPEEQVDEQGAERIQLWGPVRSRILKPGVSSIGSEPLLRPPEVAPLLFCSTKTVYAWAASDLEMCGSSSRLTLTSPGPARTGEDRSLRLADLGEPQYDSPRWREADRMARRVSPIRPGQN